MSSGSSYPTSKPSSLEPNKPDVSQVFKSINRRRNMNPNFSTGSPKSSGFHRSTGSANFDDVVFSPRDQKLEPITGLDPAGPVFSFKSKMMSFFERVSRDEQTAKGLLAAPECLRDRWTDVYSSTALEPMGRMAFGKEEQQAHRLGTVGPSLHHGQHQGTSHQQRTSPGRKSEAINIADRTGSRSGGLATTKASTSLPDRHARKDAEGEDEAIDESIWTMPTSSATGFGNFDEEGNFRMEGTKREAKKGPENAWKVPLHSAATETATRPWDAPAFKAWDAPAAVNKPAEAVPKPEHRTAPVDPLSLTAESLVQPTTRWFYRDPMGREHGPFTNQQMMDWWRGKYFQDSLPLRREQDPTFESLAAWKVHCGAEVPFVVGLMSMNKNALGPAEQEFLAKLAWSSSKSAATVTAGAEGTKKMAVSAADLEAAYRTQKEERVGRAWAPLATNVKSMVELQAEQLLQIAREEEERKGAAKPRPNVTSGGWADVLRANLPAVPDKKATESTKAMPKSTTVQPPRTPLSTTPISATSTAPDRAGLQQWCLQQLQPYAASLLDIHTVTALLIDMNTPKDVASFIRDGLSAPPRIDVNAFCRSFCVRRFKIDPAHAPLVLVDNQKDRPEDDFETVKSRHPSRKSHK